MIEHSLATCLVATLCVAACEKESAPIPPKRTEPNELDKLSGYVLLPLGTKLYRNASTDAPSLVAKSPDQSDDSSGVSMFRVVADHGEWVEIENIATFGASHCYQTSSFGHTRAELRFFVRRQELHLAVMRPYTKQFSDGTKIELKAGVAVSAIAGSANRRIQVDDIALEFQLPESAIGKSFSIGEFFAAQGGTANSAEEARLNIIAGNTLAAKKLKINGSVSVSSTEDTPEESSVRLLRSTSVGELIRFRRDCLRVEAMVPKELLLPPKKPNYVVGGILGGEVVNGPYVIAKDAPVYWRGGARAGKLIASEGFDIAPTQDGDRSCFGQTLATVSSQANNQTAARAPGSFELCFASSDVMENPSK